MKNFHPIFCLLFVFICFSCHRKPIQYETDWVAKLDSIFVWDIQPEVDGALMFLDVAYQNADTCVTDFLTMSLAKHKTRTRPDWIAVILPDNIIQEEGVFLFFKDSKDSTKSINKSQEKAMSIRVNLSEHTHGTFVVRLKDGFALDENNQKIDILKKFQESDMVYFMIFYPDGKHKTIVVPLKYFRKQYKELE